MFETLCGKCDHKNCCTNSAVPLVFSDDLEKIKKNFPEYLDFLKTVKISGQNVNAIKKKNDSTECIFWDSGVDGCKIYDSRPMDCRLYPFDILLVDGSYHWIVYSCNNDSDWSWSETYLQSLEKEPGFDELMRNIDLFTEHTNMILPSEIDKTPYEVLRKVNWKSSI